MSVVINTNTAATIAANNLASSNSRLQVSLSRLSSGSKIVNPSDDAGGLAVAMKLNSAADRQTALQSGLGDVVSYAQTQDGGLQIAGSILDRISELAALFKDPTKNTTDLANYDDEFAQLQGELTAVSSEKFNGISLFGTNNLTAATTDDLGSTGDVSVNQADVYATGSTTLVSGFSDFTTNGLATISGGVLSLHTNAAAGTNQYFSGAFQINFDISSAGSGNGPWGMSLEDTVGGGVDFVTPFSNGATHSMQVNRDNSGNITFSLDGTPQTNTDPDPLTGNTGNTRFLFYVQGALASPIQISNFVATTPSSNLSSVASASSLGNLSLSTITGAIQDVATARAQNGAEQSRLNFASTLLTTNQTNLESAISHISDVDVAAETTSLAKWNVLVQSGASMLTQANQSAQIALKLITG